MLERDARVNDELHLLHEKANARACAVALPMALAYQADTNCVRGEIPKVFGERWSVFFQRIRGRLAEKYGDKLDDLCLVASRFYVYACYHGSTYMVETFEASGGVRNSTQACMVIPDCYADYEGWANTLYAEVSSISKPMDLLRGTQFEKFPNDGDILEAMAVIWFFEAASTPPNGGKSMDVLFEAMDAAYLAHGEWMWNEAEALYEGTINPAAELAKKRHLESYALADYARQYWRENIDPALSAQRAATELTRVVPLSHKKLAEIVSSEKKKPR